MIYYLYFLRSIKNKNFYIGITNNFKRRFSEHQRGKDWATKFRRPWKLIYFEKYNNKNSACKREFFLKSPKGYLEKRKIIEKFL
jgi:putative endonuclease